MRNTSKSKMPVCGSILQVQGTRGVSTWVACVSQHNGCAAHASVRRSGHLQGITKSETEEVCMCRECTVVICSCATPHGPNLEAVHALDGQVRVRILCKLRTTIDIYEQRFCLPGSGGRDDQLGGRKEAVFGTEASQACFHVEGRCAMQTVSSQSKTRQLQACPWPSRCRFLLC